MGLLWGTGSAAVLLARQFLLWQWIQGAVASTHCISSPIAWLHSPWRHSTFNSSNELLLFRLLTHQIAVWLGFGFAWRTSSERERPGHSDIWAAIALQIVDCCFAILDSCVGHVSLGNEVHLLRDGYWLVCLDPKVQGAKTWWRNLLRYWCPSVESLGREPAALPQMAFYTSSHLGAWVYSYFKLCPFSTLKFFNLSVFSLCSPCFPHLAENTVGRDWYTRDILLLVFSFRLQFLLDDIDFQCKGRSALEQTCGETESPRPAVRLQSPCPSDRDWHLCKMMKHAPNAGSFSQWQSVGRKSTDRFSTWGRQMFYEFTFFSSDSEMVFYCILIQMFRLHIRDNFCLIWLTARNYRFLLEKMERPLHPTLLC